MASMGDMGAGLGMLVVETIPKIRRAFFCAEEADQGDLPRVSSIAESRAQGDPVAGN